MTPIAPGDIIAAGTPGAPAAAGGVIGSSSPGAPDAAGTLVRQSPGRITVTGALTVDAVPVTFPALVRAPDYAGMPAWTDDGVAVEIKESGQILYWEAPKWKLFWDVGAVSGHWLSPENLMTPVGATSWTTHDGASGQPTVAATALSAAAELIGSGAPAAPDAPGSIV